MDDGLMNAEFKKWWTIADRENETIESAYKDGYRQGFENGRGKPTPAREVPATGPATERVIERIYKDVPEKYLTNYRGETGIRCHVCLTPDEIRAFLAEHGRG